MKTILWMALLASAACADIEPAVPDATPGGQTDPSCGGPTDSDLASVPETLKRSSFDCRKVRETGFDAGTPFAIEVVRVDGKPVEVDTADAFWHMQRAAATDGVDLQVVSGFRTHSEQRYLYGCYVNCDCNSCNLAAYPGYSNHQSGQALDLNTGSRGVLWWLNRNGARFGFHRTVPSEDWHWEYLGGGPSGGVCDGSGLISLVLTDGAAYENGLWLKSAVGDGVHHVRYRVGPYLLGSSEHRLGGFPLRYVFSQLGWRDITAEAYDKNDRRLGETTVRVKITARDQPRAEVEFAGAFRDGGSYRNDFTLRVDADADVTRVRYYAGEWELASSVDAADGFPAQIRLNQLGWRSIEAVAYDRNDRMVRHLGATAKIVP